jgi:hypothetical protein
VTFVTEAKLKKKKLQTALENDLADELNGDTNALPTTRSLLDISADELTARLELDLVYSKQFSNTTVDILIFDSNFTNATFTVSGAVAALEAIVSDPDSRLRSKGFVQADSIQSISGGSVSAGDLVLCADGILRESCPSSSADDGLDDGQIAIIAIVGAIVLITLIVLLYSKKKQGARSDKFDDVELNPTALQASGAAPAPEYEEGGDVAFHADEKEEEEQEVAADNIKLEIF